MNRVARYGIAFFMGNVAAMALIVIPGMWHVLVYLLLILCTYVLCEYCYGKNKSHR